MQFSNMQFSNMQFSNMEIVCRNTFKDCKLSLLNSHEVTLVIDEGKTAEKKQKVVYVKIKLEDPHPIWALRVKKTLILALFIFN